MATSANQDATRKLSKDERTLVIHALQFAHKSALRSVSSNSDPELKNIYQTKAYAYQALQNRFATTELDF